tara:strand:+ start:959 stop:1138 length:180 start_codon:yes stop_codon:yes gene_type:complete
MRLIAKWDILHGGRNIGAGEEFEVNEADGAALISLGFEEVKPAAKTKTKTKKSAESAEG